MLNQYVLLKLRIFTYRSLSERHFYTLEARIPGLRPQAALIKLVDISHSALLPL